MRSNPGMSAGGSTFSMRPSLTFSAVSPVASLCTSLEVSVFEVPVLKREALLLPLAPFLIVKVNVCSLKQAKKTLSLKTKRKAVNARLNVCRNVQIVQVFQLCD